MPLSQTDRWGSAWAWFGSTAGSTCWLSITAVVLFVRGHPGVALVALGCFLVPLLVSLWAWSVRERTEPFAAYEIWFLTAWAMSIVAIGVVHAAGIQAEVNLPGDAMWAMWVGLLLGGTLLWLAIRRWRRRGGALAAGLFDVLASWL